jgi:hypothetical protein
VEQHEHEHEEEVETASHEESAGEVSPRRKALTGPALAPALGLRAGTDGVCVRPESPTFNVRFGLASAAMAEFGQREDYLSERPQYVLSYNATPQIPGAVRHRSA